MTDEPDAVRKGLVGWFEREPIVAFEALKGVVLSTIGLLIGFGVVHMSDGQMGQVLSEYVAISGFATAYVRSKVTSNVNVALTNKAAGFIELGALSATKKE